MSGLRLAENSPRLRPAPVPNPWSLLAAPPSGAKQREEPARPLLSARAGRSLRSPARAGVLTRGRAFMLRRFFQSRVFSKLFYELLPAAAVSVLGAFLINKYARPTDPPPQPVAAAAANAELVLLLREQQALLAEYLKKTAERQRAGAGVAAVPEAETLKAAERTAAQALRESKAAEARALAAARAGTEAPERKRPAAGSSPRHPWPASRCNCIPRSAPRRRPRRLRKSPHRLCRPRRRARTRPCPPCVTRCLPSNGSRRGLPTGSAKARRPARRRICRSAIS